MSLTFLVMSLKNKKFMSPTQENNEQNALRRQILYDGSGYFRK